MSNESPIHATPGTCTGCGACERICPCSCITVEKNEEGFGVARVNETDCISCGACKRVCPFVDGALLLQKPKTTFAFQLEDQKERAYSASGGAFAALAELVLEEGGCVCSAVDDIEHGGKFLLTNERSVVDEMRGSKYYYIDLGSDVISEMADALKEGHVLFCGLPCQVYAARQAVKNSANFIGVDLLCQGAPSYLTTKAYREETARKAGRALVRHLFRSKVDDYRGYTAELLFDDGTVDRKHGDLNVYTCSFQHKLFLREACYSCPFSSDERTGDITIGDFWGLHSFGGEAPSEISLVLCNTPSGEGLAARLNTLGALEPHSLEEAVKGNAPLRGPVKRPWVRSFSFGLMKLFGFSAATVACYPKYLIKKLLLR